MKNLNNASLILLARHKGKDVILSLAAFAWSLSNLIPCILICRLHARINIDPLAFVRRHTPVFNLLLAAQISSTCGWRILMADILFMEFL